MPTGTHRTHQHIDATELVEQLQGQRPVGVDVFGVVVLVGAPRVGVSGQRLRDAVLTGLLPSADRVGLGDQVNLGAIGAQQVLDDGFHARVGDYRDRVPIHHAGQRQPQAQGSAGGFHDAGSRAQFTAGTGAFNHVHRGPVLHTAAGIEAFQFGPEPAVGGGQRLRDPQYRGVAHQPGRLTVASHDGRALCGEWPVHQRQ